MSSPSDIALKSKSSIPGCKRPPSFGDSPQNCTGPNKDVLKMSSSSPSPGVGEIISKSSSSPEIVTEASILNKLVPERLLGISISISLVGNDDGGVNELRFGVSSGTDMADEADDIEAEGGGSDHESGSTDAGEDRVRDPSLMEDGPDGGFEAEDEGMTFETTLLNAAAAGRGGNIISAGSVWCWDRQVS